MFRLRVRSRPRACFQRLYLRLELSHVKTWIFSKVSRSDYKGLSRVSIKSEHVKDLAIKIATSTIVIRHRSDNAYIDEVHCKFCFESAIMLDM